MPRLSFALKLEIKSGTTNIRRASLVVLREKSAVKPGPVVTHTWIPRVLEADYRSGDLRAVRLLAPCRIADFDGLHLSLSKREREAIRRFIKSASRRTW